ncbi:hypothetical protein [Sporisorium scitamineum]|uniref:Vps72/YL1 C-terminal domain-containing protein n=1 Tax=Sporisorium scitamineum TaxID=49012 RepID=A0A0F7SCU3_9BASI|nr:hypothetical protein [Sporisorium scitamineum]
MSSNLSRRNKSLKQLLQSEREAAMRAAGAKLKERKRKEAQPQKSSLRPAKKYCDVTGLIAPYTDPKSGLRYHSVEVYEIIKQFGPGVDNAYLSLRGDGSQIK